MPLICHILIGPPACGKSTLARQWVKRSPQHNWISTDSIRTHLYGDAQIQGDWHTIEVEILRQVKGAIARHQPVIYDATNAYPDWRIDLLRKLNDSKSLWIGWQFHVPLEVCKLRNAMRERQVDEAVIEQFYQWLEDFPPNLSEGFAAIYSVPMVGKTFDFEAIKAKVQELAISYPQQPFHR